MTRKAKRPPPDNEDGLNMVVLLDGGHGPEIKPKAQFPQDPPLLPSHDLPRAGGK
jgi:hypothetical protein